MEITVTRRLSKQEGVRLLFQYEGESAVAPDKVIGNAVKATLASLPPGAYPGKFLETVLLRTDGAALLLIGLGKRSDVTPDRLRQGMGSAAKAVRDAVFSRLCATIPPIQNISSSDVAQAMAEGVCLGLYQFQKYKTDRPTQRSVESVVLVAPNGMDAAQMESLRAGVARGMQIAEGVNAVRDLCNAPSNIVTPTRLAEEARAIAAELNLSVSVLEREEMVGMGALLGVSRGTLEPPKFIVLEYQGAPKSLRPVVLVGKSVTFDSGGISLKPAEEMDRMKYDMTGGAIVLQTIRVAARMNLPLNIVGLLPATDNMPSGSALHPGDVVTTHAGKTVEVINTDAEGRLCLADALSYAARYNPAVLIDLATLTGAASVALGAHAMALFGNDPALIGQVCAASEESGERVWQLPLWEDYFSQIKSDIADLKNTGGRGGGAITAALFLKQFVGSTPWVHLDIAGVSWNSEAPRAYIPKGATGVGLRLLVAYLSRVAQNGICVEKEGE
jgi:leucyl aminopeptidase